MKLNKYGTVNSNPGCLGVNLAKQVKKSKDGSYKLVLSACGTKNRAGKFVDRLTKDHIDTFNSRPESQRVLVFRTLGMDSIHGNAIRPLMRNTVDDICGVIKHIEAVEVPGKQIILGEVKAVGPKAAIFISLLTEDPDNTVTVGHRFVVDDARTKSGHIDTSNTVITNIVGFDVVASVM